VGIVVSIFILNKALKRNGFYLLSTLLARLSFLKIPFFLNIFFNLILLRYKIWGEGDDCLTR